MKNFSEFKNDISAGKYDGFFEMLYGGSKAVPVQRDRYSKAIDSFRGLFPQHTNVEMFSAPGRTEVCGNHTDHNNGRVLAAGVNLDVIAVVSENDEGIVRIKSEGFPIDTVKLSETEIKAEETGHSQSLVRGICARLLELGYTVKGFDAYTTSNVLKGSGLSSSAAFEVLVGTIISHMFNNGEVDAVKTAQIAQYAENVYFGKPCGLLDQMASSVGGFVTIDFADPSTPVIEKIDFDFAASGYALCIVDTGGNHADLTDDYASVRRDMEAVAAVFGKKVLRELTIQDILDNIPLIREKTNDRAILRAIHFFTENERVGMAVTALRGGDFDTFKAAVLDSGRSSFMYNQNVFTCKNVEEQGVSLGLAVSDAILRGRGVFRIHGGGFAGTMQAFVPNELLGFYKTELEKVFGIGSCYVLSVRPLGGVKVTA